MHVRLPWYHCELNGAVPAAVTVSVAVPPVVTDCEAVGWPAMLTGTQPGPTGCTVTDVVAVTVPQPFEMRTQ